MMKAHKFVFLASKQFIKYVSIFSLTLNTSCIHTKKYEDKDVSLNQSTSEFYHKITYPNVEIQNVVYSKTKYPLSDFFEKLMEGEYNESIKKIDLDFKPTNTNNDIMHDLLDRRIIPAYVSIKNTSTQDIMISYKQFYLKNSHSSYQAFNPEYLPTEIKKTSPEAIAANIYNVTIGVTVTIVLLLSIASATGGSVPNAGGLLDFPIYNDTEKVTRIDYKNYLINEKVIKPNEQVYGLVFFSLKKVKSPHDFKLDYRVNPG